MPTERKIGSHVYRCDKLPASDGLKLLFRVSQMFRAAPGMLAGVAAGNYDKQASGQLLGLVLSEETDGDKAHDLIVELAQMCFVGADQCIVGVKPGDMLDLAKVAWFAIEVQFKDFLADSLAGT